jgi:predicted transcriptional regulator
MARSKVQIKSEIIDGLGKFPMTTHGVSRYVNCHYNTAKNRLEELRDDEIIQKDGNKWKPKKR